MNKLSPSPSSRLTAILVAGFLLPTLMLSSGCIAVLAGAGAGATVAYVRGDLDTTLDAGFSPAVRAGQKALAGLKYARISENQDALQATLIYRNASDQKIELYFQKATDSSTKLKIRVGTFGEESLQQEILTRIKSGL